MAGASGAAVLGLLVGLAVVVSLLAESHTVHPAGHPSRQGGPADGRR